MTKNTYVILNILLIFVGISGCFSVLFGAWLAHAGKGLSVSEQLSLSTALQYQFIHTIALLACMSWLRNNKPSRLILGSCIAFAVGVLCFSGSIYLKVFFELSAISRLTPLGGITLAIAWLLLALSSKKIFNYP